VVGQFSKTGQCCNCKRTRTACARRHITRRNVDARTHVLSRRYGGANCNLCLIAVVVGVPRQRDLCRRRPFLRFKAFQEGTVSPSFATESITVAPRFSSSTSSRRTAPHRFHQFVKVRSVDITDEIKHRYNECPIIFFKLYIIYYTYYTIKFIILKNSINYYFFKNILLTQ